jgi:hypothetical protein
MFERGAAPIPMFGWWCNLPDCLCGDSRLGCPSSQSRSLVLVAVYRPRIRRYRFVSKTTASLRIRRFASFHISACFLSYQASASVSSSSHRFVSKIIAPLRKPSLYQASLGLKSPLGPSPVLFPLPRVTSNLALAIQISNDDRGQDGPLPSKPAGLKPFVSKSLIPKSFDRGRLRRTFRYNDDSKDVEKRGEGGGTQPFTHQIVPTLPGHPGDFHIYSGQKSTALICGNPVPRKQTTSRKKSESRMGGMVYDAPVLLSYLPNRSWSLQEHH